MIKDAQIRGSSGFCRRRHGRRILTGKLDLREERLPARSSTSKTALAGGVIERRAPMYLEVARDPPNGSLRIR